MPGLETSVAVPASASSWDGFGAGSAAMHSRTMARVSSISSARGLAVQKPHTQRYLAHQGIGQHRRRLPVPFRG